MTDDAEAGLRSVWALEGEPRAAARPMAGAVVTAAAAITASAALAWWVAHPARAPAPPPPLASAVAPEPPQPLRYADAEPDPDQVRQAWREARARFTQGGAQALVARSVACAKALAADPRRLDFCLAFDVYAAEIAGGAPDAGPQADWFAATGDRDLALARSALPQTVDAGNRLAQVEALTTAVLPKPEPAASDARPQPRPTHRTARHAAAHRAAIHRAATHKAAVREATAHKATPSRKAGPAPAPRRRLLPEKVSAGVLPEPPPSFDSELPPF
jgi:hypothetical protein